MHLTFTAADRLLAVVAHPDDAEILCGGTLARARHEGAAIGVCVLSRGDKGQPAKPIANLAAVRKKELSAAMKLLGAELFTCGLADGGLQDELRQREKLIEVYRRFSPTLVLAHALEDYHADHRAASQLAEAASWFCASRGHATASPPLAAPPALWFMDCINRSPFEPGFYLDISPFVELKRQMLACHSSQIERGTSADFAPLRELMDLQMAARGAEAGVAAAEAFRICRAFKRTRAL
jgi:LmbE family N-acetylglucosaminyl deacetylase